MSELVETDFAVLRLSESEASALFLALTTLEGAYADEPVTAPFEQAIRDGLMDVKAKLSHEISVSILARKLEDVL